MLGSAVLFVLATATTVNPASAEATHESPAGTYEILICKGTCSFTERANVVVQGVLVWMPDSLAATEVRDLRTHGFERVHYSDEKPNACFALHTVVKDRTYAGLVRTGITSWSLEGSKLRIGFYSSPDAGYVATIRFIGEHLEGDGDSWGGAEDEPHLGRDVVVGRRVGAAFPMKCIDAAHAQE